MRTTINTIPNNRSIIEQLVSQQFFIPPNFIIDRTHRIQEVIIGADLVLKQFTEFLYQVSQNTSGISEENYLKILFKVSKKLDLSESALKKRFWDKIGGSLREGLANELILFITTIATILEVLDFKHYQKLINDLQTEVKVHYSKKSESMSEDEIDYIFKEGIKRLGEIADSNFSILQNFIKLNDLADIFNLSGKIMVDKKIFEEYRKLVVMKIVSE